MSELCSLAQASWRRRTSVALSGTILCRGRYGDTRRGYHFNGALKTGGLLAGIVGNEVWRPRTDSNCRPRA